jgi:uncharacterized protein (DUF1697 family)
MTTYISILRGINVSGKNLIRMEALKKLYEDLGLQKVETYIQSGNVIFQSEAIESARIEKMISHQILTVFGFEVPVIVLSAEQLKKIICNNPFSKDPDRDPSYMHVTFLHSSPEDFETQLNEKALQGEEVEFADQAIYLYCPDGYSRTKLTNTFLENKLRVKATTRNWKTTKELYIRAAKKAGEV